MDFIRTYYNAIKSIDNPEAGWDPVGSWNNIHGNGKSSTNVLRMQTLLSTGGVRKVRIVSGGRKKLVTWLEGMVASPYDETEIRATILAAFLVRAFFCDDCISEPICSVLQTKYGKAL